MISANHRAAREYAELGIAVFPLVPRTKVPACKHGELEGTTDPAAIDATWSRRPNLLVAAALRFTPYFALDVDRRHCGDEWLRSFPDLPATVTACSGSGGWSQHFWFRRTPELQDVRVRVLTPGRCSLVPDKDWRTGIDVKGLSTGYVVLPPSIHPSGRQYEWEVSTRLGEIPIADPPDWLVRTLRRRSAKPVERFQHEASIDPTTFYLGALFKRAGMLGAEVRNGVFAVRCPNESSHSQGASMDGSSVIFAPKKPGGRGTFFCQHTSACSEVWR
jgi:hypothetical protein